MNKARSKGTAWESALVETFKDAGVDAYRLPLSSPIGDICLTHIPIVIEAKNHRALDLAGWFAQAQKSAKGTLDYVVLHKRRGKGDPSESYATMPVGLFVELVCRAYR